MDKNFDKLIQKIHQSTGIPSEKIEKAFIEANWDHNKAMDILEHSIQEEEKKKNEVHRKEESEKIAVNQKIKLNDNKIKKTVLPAKKKELGRNTNGYCWHLHICICHNFTCHSH